ncbi:hypothetical protein SEPCBS57363_005439 [Sporothrix epigloea]|uniref:WKF domain-containing protein n=1 Tax=Sporothrix epigloea TaxID=1892477 RepID=A0ABP0DZS7_9PEZI
MSYTSTAQRVPAWKRLGLKLKGSADESNSASPAITTIAPTSASVFSPAIRKPYQSPSSSQHQSGTPSKRREPPTSAIAPSAAKRQKSVSFAEAGNAAGAAAAPKKARKPKKAKKKNSEPNPASKEPSNLDRELDYLQQWKTSRDTWKFNKNHQSLLIKYLFVGGANNAGIPATHIDTFYDYIRSLQGGVRTRLRQEAREICELDDEAGGSADTAAATAVTGSKDKTAKSDAQLKDEDEYKQIVAEIRDHSGSVSSNNNGKQPQRLCETDYELRFTDPAIQKRLKRRIRAENVVNELAGDDKEAAVTPAAEPAEKASRSAALVHRSSTFDAQSTLSLPPVSTTAVKSNERPVKLNDGTVKKPARSRKQRTAVESSDDSDSDSDSDSSSSSSDDDSSGAEIPKAATLDAAPKPLATASSSDSSSSDSESDSDSDEE